MYSVIGPLHRICIALHFILLCPYVCELSICYIALCISYDFVEDVRAGDCYEGKCKNEFSK